MHARPAILLLAFALLVTLAAPPALARNRSETVAGWRFDYRDQTGEAGWEVRMSRRGRGYRFTYYFEFWRGNGGVVVAGEFRRGACNGSDSGPIMPFAQGMSRAFMNGRLSGYLRACPLPRAEALALRRGANAAWPRFAALARRARAAMDAEDRAIMNYGR